MKFLRTVVALCVAAFAATQAATAAETLKYVVVLARHGVRSPTWTTERLNQYSATPWPDFGVPPGNLTPHGRELIKLLGTYFRESYGDQGLLSGKGCEDANRVYIWADTDQRTLETGRAFAESIVPGCGLTVHSLAEGEHDPIFSGAARADQRMAIEAIGKRISPNMLVNHRDELEKLQHILTGGKAPKPLIGPATQVAAIPQGNGVELQGPFATASTMSENLLLEYADGMEGDKLGWGRMTKDDLLRVLTLHGVYADLMRKTPYVARVRGSNLMNNILASMEQAVSGKAVSGALGSPGTMLAILAGHDTNQSNVAGILGLSWSLAGYQRDETPPGGSLIFSIWHNSETQIDSVRIEFLAASLDQMHRVTPLTKSTPPSRQRLSLPGCGKSPIGSDCTWRGFKKTVQDSLGSDVNR